MAVNTRLQHRLLALRRPHTAELRDVAKCMLELVQQTRSGCVRGRNRAYGPNCNSQFWPAHSNAECLECAHRWSAIASRLRSMQPQTTCELPLMLDDTCM